jgi:hypothetical protein
VVKANVPGVSYARVGRTSTDRVLAPPIQARVPLAWNAEGSGLSPMHATTRSLDVDRSNELSPLDALLIINYLNYRGPATRHL